MGASVADQDDQDDQDGQDALRDIDDDAEEIAHDLPELICDPEDESAEEAAMHIEDPNRA
jgi:hypothetical protein